MASYEQLFREFHDHGQEHVLAYSDTQSRQEPEQLLLECAKVDFAWLEARWQEFNAVTHGAAPRNLRPAPVTVLPVSDEDKGVFAKARAVGEDLLRQGKAAAFLVAGGQGTRLGYDGPKGSYPVGPLSNRTLFQWHAEQILARSRRYGAPIPWYIMTSKYNHDVTQQFFAEHGFFGLDPADVIFFEQQMVPCLDFDGKLMLASPSSLAMNPNGHGGSLSGLVRSGAVDDMKKRGIEVISYFQVDNPLVTIADPVFIGLHVQAGADMSSKVLEKTGPDEKIGVTSFLEDKPAVVEYTDLAPEAAKAADADGKLVYWAGSIAIHIINVDFAAHVGGDGKLPWHQNRKKVPYYAAGKLVKPEKENAVKFETFVFDALPYAKKSLNLEVKREHEFAPVKNATGVDSVESCRRLLSAYFGEWLDAAGVKPASGTPTIEISPLYSLDAEELGGKVKPGGVRLENGLLLE